MPTVKLDIIFLFSFPQFALQIGFPIPRLSNQILSVQRIILTKSIKREI